MANKWTKKAGKTRSAPTKTVENKTVQIFDQTGKKRNIT